MRSRGDIGRVNVFEASFAPPKKEGWCRLHLSSGGEKASPITPTFFLHLQKWGERHWFLGFAKHPKTTISGGRSYFRRKMWSSISKRETYGYSRTCVTYLVTRHTRICITHHVAWSDTRSFAHIFLRKKYYSIGIDKNSKILFDISIEMKKNYYNGSICFLGRY